VWEQEVMCCHHTLARHSAMLVTDLSVSSLRCLDPEKPRTICRGHVRKCIRSLPRGVENVWHYQERADVPPASIARKPPT
jgi:hypothetical protein